MVLLCCRELEGGYSLHLGGSLVLSCLHGSCMRTALSTSCVLTCAALAEPPEWTARPPVASVACVPLACTEDMGSHYLDIQDGDSMEKETRVRWGVLADPAPGLPPEKPSGASHRHRETGKG